jgi:hypothetical protein
LHFAFAFWLEVSSQIFPEIFEISNGRNPVETYYYVVINGRTVNRNGTVDFKRALEIQAQQENYHPNAHIWIDQITVHEEN